MANVKFRLLDCNSHRCGLVLVKRAETNLEYPCQLQLQVRLSGQMDSETKALWKLRIFHHSQEGKNSLKIKLLGRIFLGHQGPRRRDIPDKNFMQVAFFCCFRQGAAGMSRDLGRDVPGLEKLSARKLWADFSFPMFGGWERA